MLVGWLGFFVFQTSHDTEILCGILDGFWETGVHSRTHDGCHVSTFGSGRDNFIGIRTVAFLNPHFVFTSPVDIGCISLV